MQLLQICLWVSCTNSPLKRVSFTYTYACVFVHVLVSAYGIQKSIRSPGAGVPGSYEVPNCRELDYDPLKEQEALSTAKQFFSSPYQLFLFIDFKLCFQKYIPGKTQLSPCLVYTRMALTLAFHERVCPFISSETSAEWSLWTISLAESWLWYLQSSVRSSMLGRRLRR